MLPIAEPNPNKTMDTNKFDANLERITKSPLSDTIAVLVLRVIFILVAVALERSGLDQRTLVRSVRSVRILFSAESC